MATNDPENDDSPSVNQKSGLFSFFSDTKGGIRRSILFTLAIATGFIAVVAATSVTFSDTVWWFSFVLWAVGLLLFIFAILLALGRFESLVSDDQYFWSVGRNKD